MFVGRSRRLEAGRYCWSPVASCSWAAAGLSGEEAHRSEQLWNRNSHAGQRQHDLLFWAAHVKEQFADARAHLMPGFRRACHRCRCDRLSLCRPPAGGLGLAGGPALRRPAGRHGSSAGGRSLSMLVGPHLANLLGWVTAAGLCSLYTTPVLGCLIGLISGQHESIAVGTLIAGALVALGGGVRMLFLNEDMPAYHRREMASFDGRGRTTCQRPSARGFLSEWLADCNPRGVIRHARRATASRWSRVCRWQVGMAGGLMRVCLWPDHDRLLGGDGRDHVFFQGPPRAADRLRPIFPPDVRDGGVDATEHPAVPDVGPRTAAAGRPRRLCAATRRGAGNLPASPVGRHDGHAGRVVAAHDAGPGGLAPAGLWAGHLRPVAGFDLRQPGLVCGIAPGSGP